MKNPLKRNSNKVTETEGALSYGLLASDGQRTISEQEYLEQLGFNPHLMRTHRLESIVSRLYELAEKSDPQTRYHFITIATAIDGIFRVSRNSRVDSVIGYMRVRRALRHVKMHMPKIKGFADWIEVLDTLVMTAWNDSVDGWKARLTKVSSRAYEISMLKTKTEEGMMK